MGKKEVQLSISLKGVFTSYMLLFFWSVNWQCWWKFVCCTVRLVNAVEL